MARPALLPQRRGRPREPFNVPRVLILTISMLVVPSLTLALFGILVLMSEDQNITPYVLLMVLLVGSLATGTTLVARAAWQGVKLSRMKTDFVSHVSHELRTPLTSIRMFIETLQLGRARTDEERQQCLDMLAKETERLTEMIERVLAWSRLEAGRQVYRFQALEAGPLLTAALDTLESQNIDRPVDVDLQLPEGTPAVWADRGAALEVLVNLLSNAAKYGGDASPIVLRAEPSSRWVRFCVEDRGPGILRRERARIFESFYRAGDLLSRRTEGTGLGLSIAKRISVGLGGGLSYEPREGGGSRFVLRLPVARGRAEDEGGETKEASA